MVGDTGVDSEAEDVGISSAATSALLVGMARMTPPLSYACPGVVPAIENARVDGCNACRMERHRSGLEIAVAGPPHR